MQHVLFTRQIEWDMGRGKLRSLQFSALSGTPLSVIAEKHLLTIKTKPTDSLESCPGQQALMHDFKWFYPGCSSEPKGMDGGGDLEEMSKYKGDAYSTKSK